MDETIPPHKITEAMNATLAESTDDVAEVIGNIIKAFGNAIAALETEVILLRKIVHNDNPGLSLR